ncbi:hypothetical protein [Moritella sp. F3]|uniref:hypothetical protein n=1 Tax=Moritella sp. F3 TaxID=2718882 RepID=UPI0018E12E24|nr:hypothetical protein [Moritella sp. F3]GIC76985.1 hypothetical protein FMO001_17120 [Moritella sp. F1]GIC80168.1 hypothetical protein FMO003_04490 [Moritella sp. F3]
MKVIVACICLLASSRALSEETALAEEDLPTADVLQDQLNTMMQGTASWFDAIGSDRDSDEASAKGYLQLSWLPRTADLDDVDVNFKVSLNLPQWSERLSLVIDNDDEEDEQLLDYESNHINDEQEDVNIAFQYVKQFNQQRSVKNRVGFSRSQVYLRSEMKFNWQVQQVTFSLQPRLDYFLEDGLEPSIKTTTAYQLEESALSLSANWQKRQTESNSRRKIGFYHIKPTGEDQLLVSGVQYNKSNNADDIPHESYFISIRYRNLLYKSWMYFEVEPFTEFNQSNDFKTEVGIIFSLISYYGD